MAELAADHITSGEEENTKSSGLDATPISSSQTAKERVKGTDSTHVRGKRRKHVDWQPLEAYHSQTTLIDDGTPSQGRGPMMREQMGRAFKTILGGLGLTGPVNTLNRSDAPASQAISRPPPPVPPAKRQKVEEGTYSNALFAFDGSIDTKSPRGSFDGWSESQGTIGGSTRNKTNQASNVSEFRLIGQQLQSGRRKRTRKKSISTALPKFRENSTTISDEEKVDLVPHTGTATSTSRDQITIIDDDVESGQQPKQNGQREHSLGHYAALYRPNNSRVPTSLSMANGAKRKFIPDGMSTSKRPKQTDNGKHEELDELSYEDMTSQRRDSGPRKFAKSSSLSSRGDISSTTFTVPSSSSSQSQPGGHKVPGDVIRAKQIIGAAGLKVKQGVSGEFSYPGTGTQYTPCYLKVHEISSILVPTRHDGKFATDLAFLRVNLRGSHKVQYSDNDYFVVRIDRSADAAQSAAAKLHLEFYEADDLEKFVRWVNSKRQGDTPVKLLSCDGETLHKELVNLSARATKHATLRDSDAPKPTKPADIQLIEHNHNQKKKGGNAFSNSDFHLRQEAPPSRIKIKDSMRNSDLPPCDEETVEDISPEILESSTAQKPRAILSGSLLAVKSQNMYEPLVPSTARETRASTRVAARDPTPPPPKSWTALHKDWEDRWRNSLVFPPSGKNRATVDKEDIPRLDEGEFLNDNLVIFYLRYLQQQLEENCLDLAERIYFHNTFFYSKLKPSKTSKGGINYESVKSWTSKVDLFKKDFIIVPICESSHWYVAIIYNAPKLLLSTSKDEHTGVRNTPNNPITVDDDSPAHIQKVVSALQGQSDGQASDSAENVAADLSQMSIDGQNENDHKPAGNIGKQGDIQGNATSSKPGPEVIDLARGADDEGPTADNSPPMSSKQKKAGKRGNAGQRKHDPDQPKIITLDSLGAPHSPACQYLKHYIMAELKDKRGIEIEDPGALGMTAKDIPLQTNYCDCGLYLLGYIEHLLRDPDGYMRGLLQHEEIPWDLDSSALRRKIRDLLFELQCKQQVMEDAANTGKKNKKRKKQVAALSPTPHPVEPSSETGMEPAIPGSFPSFVLGSKTQAPMPSSQREPERTTDNITNDDVENNLLQPLESSESSPSQQAPKVPRASIEIPIYTKNEHERVNQASTHPKATPRISPHFAASAGLKDGEKTKSAILVEDGPDAKIIDVSD